MNFTCTRHLGGTVTPGHPLAGTHYASRTERKAHSTCWMEIAVFDELPTVPSLAGTMIQSRNDLLASTKGAGAPVTKNMVLQFELFDDESPKTCANFRRLCCGQTTSRQGQTYCFQGITPSYRGTFFHKIIPQFCAQGGDITMRVDGGANHLTSAGRGWFVDENKKRRHNEAGLLSMANNGPNSNGSQFFITTADNQERAFNGRHVCFGRVTEGLKAFLKEVAPYGTVQGHPSRYAVVVDCGEGVAPRCTFTGTDCEFTNTAATASTSGAGEGNEGDQAATSEAEAASWADGSPEVEGMSQGVPVATPPAAADTTTGTMNAVAAAAAAAEDVKHGAAGEDLSYTKPGLALVKSALKQSTSERSNLHVSYADGV